jgi:hypothetical protein
MRKETAIICLSAALLVASLAVLALATEGSMLDSGGSHSCISLHTVGNMFAMRPVSGEEGSRPLERYPAGRQQIAQTARFWLLSCDSPDCGLPQAREPLSLEGGDLWGFPDPAE